MAAGHITSLKIVLKEVIERKHETCMLEELSCKNEACPRAPQANNVTIPPHCFNQDHYITV